MKVDIKTVAQKAGVSIATVSRVLNKKENVSEKSRKIVLKVASELNYEINAIARSLKLTKTKTIGLIAGNFLCQFWSIIAKSIEIVTKQQGYNLILWCNTDESQEEELKYLSVLKSSRVDGIILSPTQKNFTYIDNLIKNGLPIVLIDRLIQGLNCDAVLIEDEAGAYSGVKYLIKRGYKRIAFINGPIEIQTAKARLEGYQRALNEANLPKDDSIIKIGSWKTESGFNLTEELLNSPHKPDAIFISNLELTLGSLMAIKKMGLKIPDDIGILAYSDYDWASITNPPLSVIDFPIESIGSLAIELLLKRIEGEDSKTDDYKPTILTLKTQLKIRESIK